MLPSTLDQAEGSTSPSHVGRTNASRVTPSEMAFSKASVAGILRCPAGAFSPQMLCERQSTFCPSMGLSLMRTSSITCTSFCIADLSVMVPSRLYTRSSTSAAGTSMVNPSIVLVSSSAFAFSSVSVAYAPFLHASQAASAMLWMVSMCSG